MRLVIRPDYTAVSVWAANHIAQRINEAERRNAGQGRPKPFVLGLPTGSSPIGTYRELIALVEKGKVTFRNVVTFNMDEYVGLPEDHPQSYHSFMRDNLSRRSTSRLTT